MNTSFDWNLLRSFLAVAETGSLSAAARLLGSSQPTIGRHVTELEEHVGVSLFARHARGLSLTERGAEVLEFAESVRRKVDAFERRAAGLDPGLEGTVRISASDVVAVFVLPHVLARIRTELPSIELEIVADNRSSNLLRRDADIALRMYRPSQLSLFARKAAEARLGFYASQSYLGRYGTPTSIEALREHTFLGFDRDDLHVRTVRALGGDVRREDFKIRTDSQTFHVEAVRAGLGIGAIQSALVRDTPEVHELDLGFSLPNLPIWLVAHQDLHRSARVRVVFDRLADELRRYYAQQ